MGKNWIQFIRLLVIQSLLSASVAFLSENTIQFVRLTVFSEARPVLDAVQALPWLCFGCCHASLIDDRYHGQREIGMGNWRGYLDCLL